MLDAFEILTTSGVVLWKKSYAPVNSNIINSLITDVFIEERTPLSRSQEDGHAARNPPFKKDKYTLKWTTAKDVGLIFVVCSLHITSTNPLWHTSLTRRIGSLSVNTTPILG